MPWIEKCLASCTGYPVVVIDNASTDATISYIERQYQNTRVLPQNTNTGFGMANNIGIAFAQAQGATSFFLLNQDAYLFPETISILLKFQKENEDYGIVSPIHLDGSGQQFDKKFAAYVNAPGIDAAAVKLLEDTAETHMSVPFVNAAGWMLSQEAIKKVGLFDPLFFMYGEDDNMCQRMRYHGYQIGVVPSAKMIHDRASRVATVAAPFTTAHYKEARNLYLRKFADITNSDYEKDLCNTKRDLKKRVKENAIRFRFSKAFNFYKQLQFLEKLQPEIVQSRKRNITIQHT
ncbi:MAG: GT2 family glycosyltransferase [Flavobacteriaceae bacterium]|jgi:GT2 family glycosyltransferase